MTFISCTASDSGSVPDLPTNRKDPTPTLGHARDPIFLHLNQFGSGQSAEGWNKRELQLFLLIIHVTFARPS